MSSGDPETKQKILDAARGLIEERRGGYVRLSDIGRRAGVSRQAVYLHFSSRFKLLERLADYIDEVEGVDERLAWVMTARHPADLLDRIPVLHATHRPRIAAVAAALDHAVLEDPSLAKVWRSRVEGRRQLAARVIDRLVECRALSEHWDREEAIDFICGTTSFHAWQELTQKHGWTAERYRQVISRTLREALLTANERDLPRAARTSAVS